MRLISPKNLTLLAVGVLLFLVSVPRVHQLALRDNERDAVSALRVLAGEAFTPDAGPIPDSAGLSRALGLRLSDVRHDPASNLIRRHGYLFEFAHVGRGPIVRAWPYAHGRTGSIAFLLRPEGELLSHENNTAEWSGPSSPRPTGGESGWSKKPNAY